MTTTPEIRSHHNQNADYTGARRPPMTPSGANILAACDAARQALTMALDNLDTIQRLARRANPLEAAAVLGTFTPDHGLVKAAREMLHTTQGAIETLTPNDSPGAS